MHYISLFTLTPVQQMFADKHVKKTTIKLMKLALDKSRIQLNFFHVL